MKLEARGYYGDQYFSALKRLWQELESFTINEWKDPDDGILYRKMLDKKRVYVSLEGLNRELDEVRG